MNTSENKEHFQNIIRMLVIWLISWGCARYVKRKIYAYEQKQSERNLDEQSHKIKSQLCRPWVWFAGMFCIDILMKLPMWLS